MLRIYFMQHWYQLSDSAMEDSLYDIEATHRFAHITLDRVPNENIIYHIRHFLETHELTKKLFKSLNNTYPAMA
jgi:IS5 family transposase